MTYSLIIQLPPNSRTPKRSVWPMLINAPVKFIALETVERTAPTRYTNPMTSELTTCTRNCEDSDPHMTAMIKLRICFMVIGPPPGGFLYILCSGGGRAQRLKSHNLHYDKFL